MLWVLAELTALMAVAAVAMVLLAMLVALAVSSLQEPSGTSAGEGFLLRLPVFGLPFFGLVIL